ncbi:hypothetical protein HQ325_16525 [Rhodococcus sp. BP-349]|uniref:hypothetical protein n=1 Tax=unclassified Rhodococcus (in: high G+C Gram-positive bacteria) TaxID=192944 RepID=UPI001C9AF6D2|nr:MULTISPECIES: hypothetical protein [unclassified Rhodococcus (in: high G+C Gram-positive bacteria)]MBY6540281.1 hypothetical protein [Rhodococcus sp. BP-363]MBY6545694.1 hypothetical protein [Rhodococcus sp. BP-369]MBY6564924.1 hypothetical protein [Rhodococcus sp. BP-370]MBY6578140.1 hypothetical protein [Rhodococcus sp. BP-364]MBY6587441.1 hypothetical protein [Rhodococcus sp. BP-358]
MSPRTETDGGPGEDVLDLAARIEARYAGTVAVYRDLLKHTAAQRHINFPDPRWPVEDNPLEGISLLDPGLRVRVLHSYQDGVDLGSFPPGAEVLALRIHVQAFSAMFPTRAAAHGQLLDTLSDAESDGWARALLGDHWADHSYELRLQKNEDNRRTTRALTAQRVYVLLLDQHAQPMLAPDNFAFERIWLRVDSGRKVPPRSSTLTERIRRDGPYANTEAIRDPRTDKDGRWRIHVTGPDRAELVPLANATAHHLIRGVRIRGAIDTHFVPLRVHIDPTLLWVYFRWEGDPETYVLTLRPPQTDSDLRGPPWDSPGAIVGEALVGWQEDLRTGLRRHRGATRTPVGALHLSGPTADD